MTDNEIIKALQCCIESDSRDDCMKCPLGKLFYQECSRDLMKQALSLINRQKAEIERLHKEVEYWEVETKEARADIDHAAAEAVKAFAKLLVEWAQDGSVPVCDLPDIVVEFLGGDADGTVSEG